MPAPTADPRRPEPRTLDRPGQDDYELAAALRKGTWELLEAYLRNTDGEKDSQVIVALQDVANYLGVVEQRLRPPRAA
jgi:hypothetical protein